MPILGAGFIDGLNPCAFGAVIFLISYLSMIMKRKRKEIFLTGISFTVGVFIAYFLLGLGLAKILYSLKGFTFITKFLYPLIGILTLILAILSFKDYLAIGTTFNGLGNIPYALQLAYGWTRLAFFFNLVSVLLFIPLMIAFTTWYGAVGAASAWAILNGGYIVFGIHIMHRRLLPTEKWRWYFQDVGLPLGVALLVAGILRLVIPVPVNNVALVAIIVMISAITLGATALATPITRNWARTQILNWRVSRETKS